MRIVTACNEGYYPKMATWLDSLRELSSVPYVLVKVGWNGSSGREIEEYSLGREQNAGAPNETESVQHGSFLQVVNGEAGELLIYCDGDMELQRDFTEEELDWLESFDENTVSAGPNYPGESLEDEWKYIQPLNSLDEIRRRFPGELDRWQMFNVGVLAMRREAWERLYAEYMQRWELACRSFGHQARQQWLICYLMHALGFELRVMPYQIHSHGHFGLHPGVEVSGSRVYANGKLAAIRHHVCV